MSAVIHFLKLRDPYGCLGNFWKAEIQWAGVSWRTSEHLYQALKYQGTDPSYMKVVRIQSSAWDAAKTGRKGENMRPDWDDVRVDVMLQVLRAKFSQHEDLAKVLVSTGNAVLHEHFSKDDFWADGGDGSGQSVLGQLLMQVREELQIVYGPVTREDIVEEGLGHLVGISGDG